MGDTLQPAAVALVAALALVPLCIASGALVWLAARQRAQVGPDWANGIPPLHFDTFSTGLGLTAFCLIVLLSRGSLVALAMIASALLACRASGYNPWTALGLNRARPLTVLALPPTVYLGILLPLYASALASYLLCKAFGIPFEAQDLVRLFQRLDTPLQIAGFALMALVIAPFSEEIFFRGLLHGWFKSFMPRQLSMVLTSVLFGAVHWHAPAFLPLALLGLVLALLYETTRSLWSSIALHAIFNLVTLVAVTVFPRLANP